MCDKNAEIISIGTSAILLVFSRLDVARRGYRSGRERGAWTRVCRTLSTVPSRIKTTPFLQDEKA
jgi:hypothetical protein